MGNFRVLSPHEKLFENMTLQLLFYIWGTSMLKVKMNFQCPLEGYVDQQGLESTR